MSVVTELEVVGFVVAGAAVAQGSKRVVPTRAGPRLVESNAQLLNRWRLEVAGEARLAMRGRDPLVGAVRVRLDFAFPRPLSHLRTGRNAGELRPSAPAQRIEKPDLDKLVRAVLDALTGIVFVDDRQVVELVARKRYGRAELLVSVSEVAA